MNYVFYIGHAHRSIVWKYVFILHDVHKKRKTLSMLSNDFVKMAKINSQQGQPTSPNRQKKVPAKQKQNKKMANPQKFRATRWYEMYPTRRASSCLPEWEEEREVVPESSKTCEFGTVISATFGWGWNWHWRWMKPKAYWIAPYVAWRRIQ